MIVAVYNIKKYISQCIESIISQTYTDFECILVDDGSTDGSGNICDEYAQMDSRIKVLHKKNEGLPQARKSGFDMSVGDYCLFVDGDDWLEKSMLECLIKSAELNSSDIVICDYYKAYDNRKKRVHYKIPSNKKKLMYSFVKRPDYLNFFWNKLIKRNLFVDFDISFPQNVSLCEDLFVVYKLIYYAREISCIPVCLYNYRQDNRNSITKNMSEKRFQDIYDSIPPLEKEGHDEAFSRFIDALEEGKEPEVDGLDGRRATEFVDAFYLSAATGKAVSFPLGKDSPVYTKEGLVKTMPKYFSKTVSTEAQSGSISLGSAAK